MVKFNCFIAILSLISGMANLLVGMGRESYSGFDMSLAVAQIIIAIIVFLSGLAKLNLLIKNSMLAKIHVYIAAIFYTFIVAVVTAAPI